MLFKILIQKFTGAVNPVKCQAHPCIIREFWKSVCAVFKYITLGFLWPDPILLRLMEVLPLMSIGELNFRKILQTETVFTGVIVSTLI